VGSTWGCLTGERHGEVLAEDCDFSISSGRSTLPPRIPRVAYSSLRPGCEGLDGAVMVLDALVPAPGQAQWIRFGLVWLIEFKWMNEKSEEYPWKKKI